MAPGAWSVDAIDPGRGGDSVYCLHNEDLRVRERETDARAIRWDDRHVSDLLSRNRTRYRNNLSVIEHVLQQTRKMDHFLKHLHAEQKREPFAWK